VITGLRPFCSSASAIILARVDSASPTRIAGVDVIPRHDATGLELSVGLFRETRPDVGSVIEHVAAIRQGVIDSDVFSDAIDVEPHPVGVVAIRGEHRGNDAGVLIRDLGEARQEIAVAEIALVVKNKILPPTVNCERPVSTFNQSGWRLRPSLRGKVWESNGSPRRASVSSMGFGGANAHVTLEEANPDGKATAEDLALVSNAQSSELMLLAASSVDELRQQVEKLLPIAERICHAELTDLAAALAKRPLGGIFRLALVAESPWGLADSFRLIAKRLSEDAALSSLDAPTEGIFAGERLSSPSFVALFPGQGSQRLNMGERLKARYPFVREFFDGIDTNITGRTFRETLGASPDQVQECETQLKATEIAQPAIVAASVATLKVLDFLGLRPTMAIGHSVGEITALHAAGALDSDAAVRLASLRGEAMRSLHVADAGAMLAIAAPSETIQQLLEPFGESLSISNYNSPHQTVVSGTSNSIVKLRGICQAKNIPCLSG
jgi:enediyne polyketide synthase